MTDHERELMRTIIADQNRELHEADQLTTAYRHLVRATRAAYFALGVIAGFVAGGAVMSWWWRAVLS